MVENQDFDLYACEEGFPVFLDRIHKSKPDIPLLVFSSQNIRDNIQILENLGFVDYFISKDTADRNVSIQHVLISHEIKYLLRIFLILKSIYLGVHRLKRLK